MGKKRETTLCVCSGLSFLRGITLASRPRPGEELSQRAVNCNHPATEGLGRFLEEWAFCLSVSFREEKWNVRAITWAVDSAGKAGCGRRPLTTSGREGCQPRLSLRREPRTGGRGVWKDPEKGPGNTRRSLTSFPGVLRPTSPCPWSKLCHCT